MNKFLFSMILVLISSITHAQSFSAFSEGDTVLVTLMTDGCNTYTVKFEVDGICSSDRITANYATKCSGELQINKTKKNCEGEKPVPAIFAFSLEKSKVASESEVLTIRWNDESVIVKIK